jgi:hypothetical protein
LLEVLQEVKSRRDAGEGETKKDDNPGGESPTEPPVKPTQLTLF